MTVDTKAGKINKQGPIASLEGGFEFSDDDKFLFNGDQFVQFIAEPPRAVEASANSLIYMSGDQVLLSKTYSSYKNSDGVFRLIDGNPVSTGTYTGVPTGDYDHVVVGYDVGVSTDTIKFWAKKYIPTELIRVDYSHDGEYFFEVPTHEGNVSYIFDDALKIKSTEISPSGQYEYTVVLGKTYTAKYWRIRSFIYTHNISKVTDADGKDITLATTSGLPAPSSTYSNLGFYYNNNGVEGSLIEHESEYGTVTDNGDGTYTLASGKYEPGAGNLGTVYAGAGSISVEEYIYGQYSTYKCLPDEPGCGYSVCAYGSPSVFPSCFEETVHTYLDRVETLYQALTASDLTITSSPEYISTDVDDRLPSYMENQTGPSGGIVKTVFRYTVDTVTKSEVTYNSISGNSIEAASLVGWGATDDLEPGQLFICTYPMELTQVKVIEREGPQLRYWESDGSEATTNIVSLDGIYDVSYDTADEAFYAVKFNGSGGVGSPSVNDDFSSGTGSSFDLTRWSSYGNGFYRDPDVDCLVFSNTVSGIYLSGNLVSTSYLTSDFDITLPAVITTMSGESYYGCSIRDSVNGNQVAGIYARGDWGVDTASQGISAAAIDSFINATDSVVEVRDLRLLPESLPEDEFSHALTYTTSSGWFYSRVNITSPGTNEIESRFSSVGPSIREDGFSVLLDNGGDTISDGGSVYFTTEHVFDSGINSSDVEFYISYVDTSENVQLSYDDGSSHILLDRGIETFDADFRVDIAGAANNFVTVSSTSFSASGDLDWTIPCLEVYTLDVDGELTQVSGVSTAAGVVMGTFDVLGSSDAVYEDYFNKVSIITTNQTESEGGSMVLRVGEDLYKYNKTTLPLTSRETGTSASVLSSGTLPSVYTKGLNYDAYVVGGISYLQEDGARGGVFLKTISDATLTNTPHETELDIGSDSTPFARDPEDVGVVHTVVDGDVYLYNLDEDSVAFCNIVSSDPILPASSDYSSTITARVINMFGQPLSGKRVSFAITSGAGSLAPSYGCSTSSGTVSTVFTSSSTTGTSVITATASNDTC